MSDTDEINVCSLDELKIVVKTWPNEKLGRILRVVATEGHRRFVEKVRLLWLIEDLISKVEALTNRMPDFRTKGDPDYGEQ